MKDKQPDQNHHVQSTQRKTVPVLGVHIHPISVADVLNIIEHAITNQRHILITNVNIHALNLSYTIPWFRDFLNNSEVVFCDGFGVKWAARFLGQEIPHRFTPPDWIGKLVYLASQRNFSFFFLGAREGIAQKAAHRLQQDYPHVRIDTHHGHFDKTPGSSENESVVQIINEVAPDILLIGFGMPLQEQWLLENWDRVDARVALTIGAAFDYLAGEVQRGPRWMTDNGLEWLARLVIEPKRLWKRYIVGNPLFLWRVLLQRVGIKRFET